MIYVTESSYLTTGIPIGFTPACGAKLPPPPLSYSMVSSDEAIFTSAAAFGNYRLFGLGWLVFLWVVDEMLPT